MTQPASEVRSRGAAGEPAGEPTRPLAGALSLVPRTGLPWKRLSLIALLVAGVTAAAHGLFGLPPWAVGLVSFLGVLGASLFAARDQAQADRADAQRYGQYRLVRKLGEGGMGVVYEASHAFLRRPTALKLLRPVEGDARMQREALSRFEREVQLTSQLTHPNTIVIYDYGQSADGSFYYAMEYLDGVDLERLVRVDGPLPAARVIHLALQICGSLAEAHEKALIHRDIKPGNLFVYERAGVPDTIKVMDFGLVKSLRGPVLSSANVRIGTPLYMAPELMHDPGRASPRSDIYSLGAVLHWLATGKTLQESTLTAQAPSALPVDLERLIVRCTEPDPADRPESMLQLAEELRQCRDHGAWTPELAREYWRSHGKRLSMLLSEPASPGADTLAAS